MSVVLTSIFSRRQSPTSKDIVDSETTFLCEAADYATAGSCINRPGSQCLRVTKARAVALGVSPGKSLHFCRYSVAILPEPSCGDAHGVFWPSELHRIFHTLCCALPAVWGCASCFTPGAVCGPGPQPRALPCYWRMVSWRQRGRLWSNDFLKIHEKKKTQQVIRTEGVSVIFFFFYIFFPFKILKKYSSSELLLFLLLNWGTLYLVTRERKSLLKTLLLVPKIKKLTLELCTFEIVWGFTFFCVTFISHLYNFSMTEVDEKWKKVFTY